MKGQISRWCTSLSAFVGKINIIEKRDKNELWQKIIQKPQVTLQLSKGLWFKKHGTICLMCPLS